MYSDYGQAKLYVDNYVNMWIILI